MLFFLDLSGLARLFRRTFITGEQSGLPYFLTNVMESTWRIYDTKTLSEMPSPGTDAVDISNIFWLLVRKIGEKLHFLSFISWLLLHQCSVVQLVNITWGVFSPFPYASSMKLWRKGWIEYRIHTTKIIYSVDWWAY